MQFSKKIFGDSDKKAYFCSNKSHHASQRCVPRWDFAFYMGPTSSQLDYSKSEAYQVVPSAMHLIIFGTNYQTLHGLEKFSTQTLCKIL